MSEQQAPGRDEDVEALAEEICREHDGEIGGPLPGESFPCSGCRYEASIVLDSPWLAARDAHVRTEAWCRAFKLAEASLHALASRPGYDPWARAIVGQDAVKALRAAILGHTIGEDEGGATYCEQCSAEAGDWVPWPCPRVLAPQASPTSEQP